MRIWLLLTAIAACGHSEDALPDAKPAADELAGYHDVGPDNQAGFALELGDVTQVIAQGSKFFVSGRTRHTAPQVAAVTADDPAALTITKLTVDEHDATEFFIELTAPAAGDTDIVLRDAANLEIDRLTLHVRPTDELALDGPNTSALVLEGGLSALHVTTKTAGVITVGTGAVSFTLNGLELATPQNDGVYGDHVVVHNGTGSIDATAPNATTHFTLTSVAASALTTISASAADIDNGADFFGVAYVSITTTASGVPVYGGGCTWSTLPGLVIDGGGIGSLGGDPAVRYGMHGNIGTYKPTCTLANGLSVTINVHIVQ